jgi:hypothetical protein
MAARRLGSFAKWLFLLVVGAVITVAILAGVAVLLLRGYYGPPMTEHHNHSFRYGERVFDAVYGRSPGRKSVTTICEQAVDTRVVPSRKPIDVGEAVAGCRFEERAIDS